MVSVGAIAASRSVMDSVYKDYCPGNYCVYCGEVADHIDHAPPVSRAHWYARQHFKQFFRVPACEECNVILADKDIPHLHFRCEYLITQYRRKYRGQLRMPPWAEGEILEMGPLFRKYIRGQQFSKDTITIRMKELERNFEIFKTLYEPKEWEYCDE